MSVCPFAVNRLIPPGSSDPRITPRMAILHVAVTTASSLWDYFAHRSGGIESHFYIRLDGTIEQYRDTAWQADANYLANDFAVSIETAGLAGGKWTLRQRRSIKRLLLWLNEVDGIPLEKVQAWDGQGVGYHTQFGAPGKWTPVAKSCPGPARIAQFGSWLVPWMASLSQPAPLAALSERLQIVTANLWRENPNIRGDLRLLSKSGAHIIGCQETAHIAPVTGYRWVPGGTRDVRTLVRTDIEVVEHGTELISQAVGISPERHVQWFVYKWHGVLRAHVNTHWNSHVQAGAAKPYHLPRLAEYIKGARKVAALVANLRAQGYAVTVTGDLNWSYTAGHQWRWAPRVVFGHVGLTSQYEAARHPILRPGGKRPIDYVFFDRHDLRLVAQRLIDGEHSDHAWQLCEFAA